jgi:hypothetical protein
MFGNAKISDIIPFNASNAFDAAGASDPCRGSGIRTN